jgi:uracil-DNA glycosylase
MTNLLSTLIPVEWKAFWDEEVSRDYLIELDHFITKEYASQTCYPPKEELLNAIKNLAPQEIKCIIIGQDPYHGPNQANGLAFSVTPTTKLPPSLKNIFKEYCADLALPHPNNGDLTSWKKNGVLLLNTALSVRQGEAGSHAKKGWEEFTQSIMRFVLRHSTNAGFICFGAPASKLAQKVLADFPYQVRTIIETPHPSPLSAYRGFFGSKPFTRFNNEQRNKGLEIVHWELPSSSQQTLF